MMTPEMLIASITLFVLAIFLGFELITKVPSMLHTPLMSGANAISGISVVGALLAANVAYEGGNTAISGLLAFVAIVLAMINVVGGFAVTTLIIANTIATNASKPEIAVLPPSYATFAASNAPTTLIPEIAFAPLIKGVCSIEGTFVINSKPRKIARTNNVMEAINISGVIIKHPQVEFVWSEFYHWSKLILLPFLAHKSLNLQMGQPEYHHPQKEQYYHP
jgi:NAD(P) transhydrogenase subunit alpha